MEEKEELAEGSSWIGLKDGGEGGAMLKELDRVEGSRRRS